MTIYHNQHQKNIILFRTKTLRLHAEPLDELQRLHDKSLERFQPFIACLATRERPAGELERSRIEAHIDQFHAAWRARA